MNAKKWVAILSVTAMGALTLGETIPVHAAANFTSGSKMSRNPMGPATGSNKAEKYNIAMPKEGMGYFSGGTQFIGQRVGTSAAGATSTVQVMVSKSGKVSMMKMDSAKAGKQPKEATLRLDGVPNINFKMTKDSELKMNDAKLMIDNYDVAKGTSAGKMAFDGNDKGLVQISDKTMNDKAMGWTLFAALSPLMDKDGDQLDATLNLKMMDANGAMGSNAMLKSSDGAAQTVLMADKGMGMNTTKAMIDKDATNLMISKNENVQPGVYQANIVWTLANSANAQANMANANANRGSINNH